MSHVTKIYDTLSDFLTEVTTGKAKDPSAEAASQTGSKKFTGTANFEESLKIAREGKDLGKIDVDLKTLRGMTEVPQMTTEYDVRGAEVNIGMFLEGVPECMVDYQIADETRYTTLAVDLSESSRVEASVFVNKAVAIGSLVERLELNNTRVRVIVYMDIEIGYGDRLTIGVTIKDHQNNIGIAQVMGCLHPGFFRRLIFTWMEKFYHDPNRHAYGYPLSDRNRLVKGLTEHYGSDLIIFENTKVSGNGMHSLDDVKRYVETLIDRHENKN